MPPSGYQPSTGASARLGLAPTTCRTRRNDKTPHDETTRGTGDLTMRQPGCASNGGCRIDPLSVARRGGCGDNRDTERRDNKTSPEQRAATELVRPAKLEHLSMTGRTACSSG